jgi:hypothetical protein
MLFLPWMLFTAKTERDMRLAIDRHPAFSTPEFPFKFAPTMKWDPLGFMGQGRQAGFWDWTPERLVLADGGRAYFSETEDAITSLVGAGRREVAGIDGYQDRDGRREVRFQYRWTELTPPAQALLSKPPVPGRKYDGRAIMVKEGRDWRVEELSTPDFDIIMRLLKDTGEGVLR